MKIYWAIEDKKGKLVGVSYGPTIYNKKKIASALAEEENGERPIKVKVEKVGGKK